MATYKSGQSEVSNDFKPHPQGNLGVRYGSFDLTAALATGDIIKMMHVYPNETVMGFMLKTTDLDAGTAITLSVGYGDLPADLLAADTIGQAGGTISHGMGNTGAMANGPVTFKASAAAGASGNLVYAFDGVTKSQPNTTLDVKVVNGPSDTSVTTGKIEMWAFVS